MLRNNHSNVMIGFFPATGAYYTDPSQHNVFIKLPDDRFSGIYSYDHSFADLTDILDFEPDSEQTSDSENEESNQHVFGYNGCGKRGGFLFADGIEQPVLHLYEQVLKQVETLPPGEKIKLVLIGHSRGALSAILLAKKIKMHPELKKRVKVILDLRDPVPGNLHHFAKIDFAHTTIAKQLSDLTDCPIDEVHITIQERESLPVGFDVLIPSCHPKTKLQIEMLPGVHEIQGRRCYRSFIHPGLFSNDAILTEHPTIYLMGILKSLQIMHEQGTPINYRACLNTINNFLRGIPNNNFDHAGDLLLPQVIIDSLFHPSNEIDSSEGFSRFLKMLQLHLYDALFLEFKAPDSLPNHKRDLHFGGAFALTAPDPTRANCFNMRHAALIQEMLGPNYPGYYPRPLLGFKFGIGERPWKKRTDLNNARFIKIPDNLFQQKYQRIMLVLDQQIKSNLVIPTTKKLYIDVIKRDLIAIAEENISETQKQVKMETYLLHMYWEVRAHEGMLNSRLRRGIEWILNSPYLLDIKGRYGLSFPEKPENDNFMRKDLLDASVNLSNILSHYAKGIENHPKLYQHGIKFLHGLKKIQFKTERKKEVKELFKMIQGLLEVGKESSHDTELFATFKLKLLTKYKAIREHESSKLFSYFRVSALGNFIEKFLRDELKIKDIPHEYNAIKIDEIITRIAENMSIPLDTVQPIIPPRENIEILREAVDEEDVDEEAEVIAKDSFDHSLKINSESESKKPVIAMLYSPIDGVENANKMLAFYAKYNVNIVLISPDEGMDHPIFKTPELISGIILPGGPNIPSDDNDIRKKFEIDLLNLACEENRKIPLLGICRGHQLIASQFGAEITDIGNISHNHRRKLLNVKNAEGSLVHNRLGQKYEKHEARKKAGIIENTILTKDHAGNFSFYTVCAHSQWALFGTRKVNRFPNKKIIVTIESGHGVPEGLQIDDHILTYQHHHEAFWEDHGENEGKVARALLKQFVTMVKNYDAQQKNKLHTVNKSLSHGT